LKRSGNVNDARAEFESAETLLAGLVSSFPQVLEYRELQTKSAFQFAALLQEIGESEAAATKFRTLSSATALSGDFPDNRNYLEAIADSHERLGDVLLGLGKAATAKCQAQNRRQPRLRAAVHRNVQCSTASPAAKTANRGANARGRKKTSIGSLARTTKRQVSPAAVE
jgi:hypothetical protein